MAGIGQRVYGRSVSTRTRLPAPGRETTGSATLVKEGDAWKVEDEAWAEPQPKTEGGS